MSINRIRERTRTSATGTSRSTFWIDVWLSPANIRRMAALRESSVYPQRLHHETPAWVKTGSLFHVRIRAAAERPPLTHPELGGKLFAAAQNYHQRNLWYCELFLLMPDHLHALLAFPSDGSMAKTIGAWKRYGTRELGVNARTRC